MALSGRSESLSRSTSAVKLDDKCAAVGFKKTSSNASSVPRDELRDSQSRRRNRRQRRVVPALKNVRDCVDTYVGLLPDVVEDENRRPHGGAYALGFAVAQPVLLSGYAQIHGSNEQCGLRERPTLVLRDRDGNARVPTSGGAE
jgi:hypothetical protein